MQPHFHPPTMEGLRESNTIFGDHDAEFDSRLPLYAKECYGWDVLKANSIAETESSAIAYYFYAMQKGRELNLERLVELGLYIRFVGNHF